MRFSDIYGNEAVKQRLRAMVDDDHIPHALLLHGPTGTGKLAMARAFAQYLHCTDRRDGEPCGKCPNCLAHQSLNHADTYFVFPVIKQGTSDKYIAEWREFLTRYRFESYQRWQAVLKSENAQPMIYVTESESIIHKMNLAAFTAPYKVMIIWLPEKMNEGCANKLLKIIEEPSSDSIFVLVSDDESKVLPTIYSRVQRVEMKPVPTPEVARYLEEAEAIDPDTAMALAAIAEGDIVAAEESLKLDSEQRDFFTQFVDLMRKAYSRDFKGLRQWSEKVSDYKREKCCRFLEASARLLRENFIFNVGDRSLCYLRPEEAKFSSRFAPFINERNVEAMAAELDSALRDIRGNANAKIVLFHFSLNIAKLIKA